MAEEHARLLAIEVAERTDLGLRNAELVSQIEELQQQIDHQKADKEKADADYEEKHSADEAEKAILALSLKVAKSKNDEHELEIQALKK